MHLDKKNEILRKGQKVVEVSALVSLTLAILKAVAGFLSGSLALLSSALDSFVDLIGQAASWIGFKISQRKPDGSFRYGYYKAESLATLVVSFFIVYAAVRLFLEGYARFFAPSDLELPFLALSIAAINIAASFFLSNYLGKKGREISSPLLLTCSNERRMDIVSGSAVFLAVFTSYYHFPYIEGTVVMALSLLILKVGIFSVRDSALILMDMSPSKDIEKKIERAISRLNGDGSFQGLRLRRSGPFIFGEVKLRVRKSLSVNQAHEIAEKIEREAKKVVSELDSLTVHIEPHSAGICKVAIPISSSGGLGAGVFRGIKEAPYMIFASIDKDKGKVEKYYSKKKPLARTGSKDYLKIEKFISGESPDVLISPRVGLVSLHLRRYHMVEVYSLSGKTAKEVLEKFLKGKLRRLS